MQNENKITIEECQKLLEQNPFGSLLQMKITEAEQGRIKAELPFKKEFTNIYGDLHGGVLYSAVDTICGIAAGTYGYYVTTVDGQIRYLKSGACNRICYMHRQSGKARKEHYSSSI